MSDLFFYCKKTIAASATKSFQMLKIKIVGFSMRKQEDTIIKIVFTVCTYSDLYPKLLFTYAFYQAMAAQFLHDIVYINLY